MISTHKKKHKKPTTTTKKNMLLTKFLEGSEDLRQEEALQPDFEGRAGFHWAEMERTLQ